MARALVVDDDEPIRSMLTKFIERENVAVDVASDGAEAIARIDSDGYCVILLDLMMPRVDGFAVIEHLRKTRPEELAITIVASAIPESEIVKRIDIPLTVHPKPFDIPKLLGQIRERVQRQQPPARA